MMIQLNAIISEKVGLMFDKNKHKKLWSFLSRFYKWPFCFYLILNCYFSYIIRKAKKLSNELLNKGRTALSVGEWEKARELLAKALKEETISRSI